MSAMEGKSTLSPSSSNNGSTEKASAAVVTVAPPPQEDWKFILREAFSVMRPGLGAIYSTNYLFNNQHPSLAWWLYFAFIYPLATNAGNDYMDWEHDRADPNRTADSSRGMATSKTRVWYMYALSTMVTALIGYFHPGFALLYWIWMEIAGQGCYNGIFLGIPICRPSLIKRIGFPLDIVQNVAFYAFSNMVASQSWVPPLDLCAAGTAASFWAQLKDYDFEKNTKVRTTATVLGLWPARLLALATIPIMLQGNLWFLPFCIFLPIKMFYHKYFKKPKLTVFLFYNTVWIVLVQFFQRRFGTATTSPVAAPELTPPSDNIFMWAAPLTNWHHVRIYTGLVAAGIVARVAMYLASFFTGRYYYAWAGIYHRKRPYNPRVWDERDPYTLLLKIMPMCGRSATALMMLFPEEDAPLSLYLYFIFRVQDTWADVCVGRPNKLAGLQVLPTRLRALMKGEKPPVDEMAQRVEWTTDIPKHVLHVDMVKNVHRLDPVFLSLSPLHQEVAAKYAESLSEGMRDLEMRQGEPPSRELTRRTAQVGNDIGVTALLGALGLHDLAAELQTEPPSLIGQSFKDFSDFTYYPNLITTMEEDVKEGVFHDVALQNMKGLDEQVMKKVKAEFLRLGLSFVPNIYPSLCHASLERSRTVRIMFLGFFQFSVETYKALVAQELGTPFKKNSVWKVLMNVILDTRTLATHQKAAKRELAAMEDLRRQLIAADKKAE